MRRLLPPLAAGLVLLSACADDATQAPTGLTPATIAANSSANAIDVEKMDAQDLPKNAHVFFARGQARRPGGGSSPNLTYHGGPVMTTAVVKAVFWGASWGNASFASNKIVSIDSLYGGYSATKYSGTNTEYTGAGGAHVTSSASYAGHVTDYSPTPRRIPSTSEVLDEVCRAIGSDSVSTDGYYPVYVDVPRGHAQYCAWHSHGPCGGKDIQFGLVLNLDGDSGCDPGDKSTGHSQGLAAIANVSGHELSEAVTDPDLNAWYDASGAENSDKCAWSFSGTVVTLANKSTWKIQGNWSNAAYNGDTGYANSSGQKGCIDGNQATVQ